MAELIWEEITQSWGPAISGLAPLVCGYRARVPGGWLVYAGVQVGHLHGGAADRRNVVFVPDADGRWGA